MNGHILVVDDEELYRQLLTSRLGRGGYRVSEAANGETALELAQQASIDRPWSISRCPASMASRY